MKVLFVGNSHTYFHDMPYIFQQFCRARGIDAEVVMLTRGGESLAGHGKSEQVRFNLLYGGYDHVVLQEVESEFPGEAAYIRSLEPLLALARRAHISAALYMNFAPEGQPQRQAMLAQACRAAGDHFQLPVAAVGEAFAAVAREHPALDLYHTDRRHASPAGSYLIALCLAKTVAGIDPLGLPFRIEFQGEPVVALSEADARILQQAAAR